MHARIVTCFLVTFFLLFTQVSGLVAQPRFHEVADPGGFEFFESYIIPIPDGGRSLLIGCFDMAKPAVALEQKAWTEFGEKNGFGLMSIGFKPGPGIRDKDVVGRELARLIDEAVAEAFPGNPKRIGYARNWGAEWFLRAIQR